MTQSPPATAGEVSPTTAEVLEAAADHKAGLLFGEKYSPNLKRWLVRHGKRWPMSVYARDGHLWIGFIEDGMWFIGSRLGHVLGVGARADMGCWTFSPAELTPVEGFWADYARIGRCAIDTAHSTYFIGGDKRTCNWCGARQSLRRWTETVERSRWENAALQAAGGGD